MRRLVVFIFFILHSNIFAAGPREGLWETLTTSDGLSQGMIYDLIQDDNGLFWIATKDGLNRYDGYSFDTYLHNRSNPYSISGNTVTSLFLDSKKRIWVGTDINGLNLFDVKRRRFYKLMLKSSQNDVVYIKKIKEAPDGRIWIATYSGEIFLIELPDYMNKVNGFPFSIDFTKEVRITKLFELEKHISPTHDFFFESNGKVKIVSGLGLLETNWKKPNGLKIIKAMSNLSQNLGSVTRWEYIPWKYQQLVRDESGRFWGLYERKLVCIDANGKQEEIDVSSFKSPAQYVHIARNGQLYVFFENEFGQFDPDELFKTKRAVNKIGTPIPFDANTTLPSSLYEDRTGVFWIGTVGFGIRKVRLTNKEFQIINEKKTTYSIFEDKKGNVYINNSLKYFVARQADKYEKVTQLPLKYKHHLGLLQDQKDDSFWVLASQINMPKNGTISEKHVRFFCLAHYTADWQLISETLLPHQIKLQELGGSFKQVRDGSLWFPSTNGYLVRYIPERNKFEKFSFASILTNKGINKDVYYIHESIDNILWVATRSGLLKVKRKEKSLVIRLFDSRPDDLNSLPSNFISSVLDDPLEPSKYLWISTRGAGVIRMDKKNETFDVVDKKNGLMNLVIYGMLVGTQKNIWVSTNYGISRINPKTLRVKNYTKRDGLQDEEFNTFSFAKSPTGELLFGGVNGVTRFNPAHADKVEPRSEVQIVRMWVNNEILRTESENSHSDSPVSIEYLDEVNLSHNQNQISFDLALMNYSNPTKNQYRYRINGITDGWVKLEGRTLNFSHLAPDKYRLEIEGSADGETWSNTKIFTFTITPPFYFSDFAYFIYFILISIGLTWLYRVHTQRLLLQQRLLFEQKESERLSELNDLKTSFFTSISHEFRTPLTLIIGAVERLSDQGSQHTQVIRRHAKRLLNLTNQLLDLSKLEAEKSDVDLKPLDVTAFVEQLAQLFYALSKNKQVHFEVTKPATPQWVLLDADKLEKIIVNLLSNAFKFTKANGQIHFTVRLVQKASREYLTLRIDDTGIGIKEEDLPNIFDRFFRIAQNEGKMIEGTGIGLTLVKELVTLLDGKISVHSEYQVGTSFLVEIPVEYVYAQPTVSLPVQSSLKDVEDLYKGGTELVDTVSIEKEKQKNTLLIVDDNLDIRWLIQDVFKDDYVVITAENGLEGIEKALECVPDLILTDLMMPAMNGIQMADILLSDERTSHIPIIMLTAKVDEKVQIESLQKGVIDYLVKPFAVNHLKLKVHNLLVQRDKSRDFFKKKPLAALEKSPQLSTLDKAFLQRLNTILEKNYQDPQFNVDKFGEEMNMSNSQLLRKLRALLDMTVVEYIRDFRLSKAESIFRNLDAETVSDVAYKVGFQNLSYFSKVFQEKYSVSPSEFMEICQASE